MVSIALHLGCIFRYLNNYMISYRSVPLLASRKVTTRVTIFLTRSLPYMNTRSVAASYQVSKRTVHR